MAYKPMWDWLDKVEGKKEGSSYENLQKEIERQGGKSAKSSALKNQVEAVKKNVAGKMKKPTIWERIGSDKAAEKSIRRKMEARIDKNEG